MSRFCLWKAVSFTRFWSRFGDLRGFDLSPLPPKGYLRGQCHSGSLFTRFWSHLLYYFRHDRSEFLFIGKLCKVLLLFIAFCEFQPLLCGTPPFFLPLFRQKSTFFVETAQSDSQYLVAFLWKWITFGVHLRPLPASPHLRGFDLVLEVPRIGERYKPRESAPCVTPAERSKPRALEQAEIWLSEIKTSQIAARLSVGGEIKTSYIHYIYSIYILSFLRSKPRKSSLPGWKCEIKTS